MHRYTRAETRRIAGVEERQLRYWERLRLIHPRIRWRERSYTFGDLVALRNIRGLVEGRVPARRLRRALEALNSGHDGQCPSLAQLRMFAHGRQVVLILPEAATPPIDPLRRQYLLPFASGPEKGRVQCLPEPGPSELFEQALALGDDTASAAQAVGLYLRILESNASWIEARINLGVAYYHMGELQEAATALVKALEMEPEHPVAHFDLGCVFDEGNALEPAIGEFACTTRIMPDHADAHFNLAACLEKADRFEEARAHWQKYVALRPSGEGAGYARARLRSRIPGSNPPAPIPFPGNN